MTFGEISFLSGIVTQIEFKDKINLVLVKIKYFENKSGDKEKIIEINKDLFEEKLADLVIDTGCFIGIRKNTLKTVERMKKGFDPSLYDKLPAREWYGYKKEMLASYDKYFREDVLFIKVISDEDDLCLSAGNLEDCDINMLYNVWKRLNGETIKSISRRK